MLDRSIAPTSLPLHNVPFPGIQENRLPNGIPVYICPFGSQELVELSILFPAGRSYERRSNVASFAAKLIQEGTHKRNALEFARQLDFFGASIHIESGFEYATVTLTCLSKHLPGTIPLLEEMLTQPAFAEAELENLRVRTIQHLDLESRKTEFNARKYFNRMLFGEDHPYGRHAEKEDISALSNKDLRDFHSRFYNLANARIVVCGRFDAAIMNGLLNQHLGQLGHIDPAMRVQENESLGHNFGTEPTRQLYYHQMADTMQATIRVGHRAFTRSNPDHQVMQVVNTALGGYFGSRLMKNIREDKGYTYGIGSAWLPMKYSGLFVIQTDVDNKYARPTLTEIDHEIERFLEHGVEDSELNLVKNYMLGRTVSGRETPPQIAGIIRNMLIHDLPFTELDEKFHLINAVTKQDVLEMARKWIQPSQLLQVVCGKLPDA